MKTNPLISFGLWAVSWVRLYWQATLQLKLGATNTPASGITISPAPLQASTWAPFNARQDRKPAIHLCWWFHKLVT